MTTVIETNQLTKYYGEFAGLLDLDIQVKRGEVLGLLGPNGAGKTTTIRLLMNFIRPTTGSARVFGLDVADDSISIRRRTGYLPGDFTTYPDLKASEIFEYFVNLRDGRTPHDLEELCRRFDLDPTRKFGELSRGNRQKVGLVQAYMGNPELVILDEPSSGLDPLLQVEFLQLVKERQKAGVTQFISSHLLPEIEAVCDRVGIIRKGRMIAVETIDGLKAKAMSRTTIEVHADETFDAVETFRKIQGVEVENVTATTITLRSAGSADMLIKAAANFTVTSFHSYPPALDEVFMAYYNGTIEHWDAGVQTE